MERTNFEEFKQCSKKETIDAASSLMELKNGKLQSRTSSNTKENNVEIQDQFTVNENKIGENSAWMGIFSSVKQDLYCIDHFVRKILKMSPSNNGENVIETTFDDFKLSAINGYILIQHAVTFICNNFRNLLQQSLSKQFVNREQLLKHENLLFQIIHYINKYESHVWQEQGKYCKCYSSSLELVKFKTMLKSTKISLEEITPTQRFKILDAIKSDAMCIQNTGLLATHAYQHIAKMVDDICNPDITQNGGITTQEAKENVNKSK